MTDRPVEKTERQQTWLVTQSLTWRDSQGIETQNLETDDKEFKFKFATVGQ